MEQGNPVPRSLSLGRLPECRLPTYLTLYVGRWVLAELGLRLSIVVATSSTSLILFFSTSPTSCIILAAMDSGMSIIPSHLRFPPETLRNIPENFRCRKSPDELSYLWTTVRLVSKQFKDDVEDIFRTEHLPKSWLYLDNSEIYDLYVKLYFDTIQSRYPGRAVFTSRLDRRHQWDDVSKPLLARVGTSRLGDADRSVPESRMRLYTCRPGLFVVQVRGSLCDCAIPSLNFSVNPLRLKISFEWRYLFHQFFGERKMVRAVLDGAPICNLRSSLPDLTPLRRQKNAILPIYKFRVLSVKTSINWTRLSARIYRHSHNSICRHIVDTCR